MTLFTIPLRCARAKWLRTLLLAAVFTLGVASMTGLRQVSAVIGDSFEKKLVSYGANILVMPEQKTLKISYGGYALGDVALEKRLLPLTASYAAIETMPLRANIAVIAPKLLTATTISEHAAALVGVDWKAETSLKGYWQAEGRLPAETAPAEALAGALLAEALGILPGQVVSVEGRELLVTGVLRPTGSDDDTVLFAPLGFVQAIAGSPDKASFLEVAALCSGCPIEDIVAQLGVALPGTEVRALRQVAESRMYAVHFARNLTFSISLVILVTACAMLVMSMLSAVAERRKEIGIMRAVGFSRFAVFVVFVVEALGIGLPAGVIGYLAGHLPAGWVLERLHLADVALPAFEPGAFALTVIASGLAAGLAAAFPAWKASRVEPAQALVSL